MSDMDTATIQQRLRAMQDRFESAPVGGFADELAGIDDGEGYQGRVEAFEMFPGVKDPSALYLKTIVSIQNHSEHAGRQLTRLDNLMDEDKIVYFKNHFHALGVDVEAMDLADVYPGSDLLNSLLDAPFVFDIYTNKRGYRNWAIKQRLDGDFHSDLGTAQQQIESFEQNTPEAKPKKAKPAKRASVAQQAAATEAALQKAAKPENCTCEDPFQGKFDADCKVPGHGIEF